MVLAARMHRQGLTPTSTIVEQRLKPDTAAAHGRGGRTPVRPRKGCSRSVPALLMPLPFCRGPR